MLLVLGPTTTVDTALPWAPPAEPPEPHWCEADEDVLRLLVQQQVRCVTPVHEHLPWAVPGVPLQHDAPPDRAPDVAALLSAVQQVLATDPVLLPGTTALERARLLLEAHGRLAAAVLPAVRDVVDRDLWEHAQVGSTRTWLRSLPSGEGAWLHAATQLAHRPVLSRALADGALALRTVRTVAAALDRVPADLEEHQLVGVLSDGVPSVLALWLGAGDLRPTPEAQARYAARRAELDAAVASAADAVLPADRLEPALALVARVLPPGEVPAAVGLLVDALEPERLEDAEQREEEGRELSLTRASSGGWTLKGRLDEETGQLLQQLLQHHRPRRHDRDAPDPDLPPPPEALAELVRVFADPTAPLGAAMTAETGAEPPDARHAPGPSGRARVAPPGTGEVDERCGPVGPGAPPGHDSGAHDLLDLEAPLGPVASPPPRLTFAQRQHDGLRALLRAALALPARPGRPTPTRLLVTAPLSAAEAALDALGQPRLPGLPGLLHTGGAPRPLSPAALRRLGCTSRLTAVLVDAARRPLATSRPERDADQAERDALRAVWGAACAVRACCRDAEVPHHVEPFALSRRTALEDLVPVCEACHQVLHLREVVLRLRDGRLIGPEGWVAEEEAP